MAAPGRTVRAWTPTGIFGILAFMLVEQRLRERDETKPDPSAITLGEVGRTMEKMGKTLDEINAKLNPLADRMTRAESRLDANAAVLTSHATAIKTLEAKP